MLNVGVVWVNGTAITSGKPESKENGFVILRQANANC